MCFSKFRINSTRLRPVFPPLRSTLYAFLLVAATGHAEVRLPAVFGDHLILQQQTSARIWGWADPGEQVTLRSSWGSTQTVHASTAGRWSTDLDTPVGSHTPHTIRFEGENIITLRNVLIGEVWLCSGQSNMAWRVRQSRDAEAEIAAADHPLIHFLAVPTRMAWEAQDDIEAKWQVCRPDSSAELSAVGYFFARDLVAHLNVPIGLIVSAFGGSDAQAWLEPQTARQYGLGEIVDWHEKHQPTLQALRTKWLEDIATWKAQQLPESQPDFSTRPKRPLPGDQHLPFGLYHGMIHPLLGFSICGALWYQGETNVPRAHQYRTLFPAMVHSWRTLWEQGDFPFYYVQIAPFHYKDPTGSNAAELRDAQLQARHAMVRSDMVVISDIGNLEKIHPANKQDVGRRLALLALHHDYEKVRAGYSSPFYQSHRFHDDRVRIFFDRAKQLKAEGGTIIGFTIAGSDRKFHPAKARIVNGNQIEVWSEDVTAPEAVRYGWSNAATMNLFNEISLPLSTFKTDNWPDSTSGLRFLDFP